MDGRSTLLFTAAAWLGPAFKDRGPRDGRATKLTVNRWDLHPLHRDECPRAAVCRQSCTGRDCMRKCIARGLRPTWSQSFFTGWGEDECYLINSCPLPRHTTQTVAPNRKIHATSITLTWDILKDVRVALFSFFIFIYLFIFFYYASKERYLRIKNPFIAAQTKQDWGWNFDVFQ